MSQQETSGYESFDFLNNQIALTQGGQTTGTDQQGSFSRAMNSINDFLRTATNTIVTVDGVINQRDQSDYSDRNQYHGNPPAMSVGSGGGAGSVMKMIAVAGVATVGSVIAVKALKK
jgi:hypothetical protein